MHRDMEVLAMVRRTGKPHIAPAPEAAVSGAWKVTVPNWNYGWTDTLAAGFIVMCADRGNAIQEAGRRRPTQAH